MNAKVINPTEELYAQLMRAAEHFNATLFAGQLPSVVFTLQREKTASGYFCPARWLHHGGAKVSEIAINPRYIATRPLLRLFQTIVHEQCHLWQHEFGTSSRSGYHNEEWAGKMQEVGLVPSETGQPGGKQIGQKMSDYPAEGGQFIQACVDLMETGFRFSWIDENADQELIFRSAEDYGIKVRDNFASLLLSPVCDGFPGFANQRNDTEISKKRKIKYTCSHCHTNLWGKSGLSILCGECGRPYREITTSAQ